MSYDKSGFSKIFVLAGLTVLVVSGFSVSGHAETEGDTPRGYERGKEFRQQMRQFRDENPEQFEAMRRDHLENRIEKDPRFAERLESGESVSDIADGLIEKRQEMQRLRDENPEEFNRLKEERKEKWRENHPEAAERFEEMKRLKEENPEEFQRLKKERKEEWLKNHPEAAERIQNGERPRDVFKDYKGPGKGHDYKKRPMDTDTE